MKIDNSYAANLLLGNNKTSARASKSAQSEATSEVHLSGLASALSASASEGAPVNQTRVEELRQAIASGQFKIDASAIADRLLDTAKELVQANTRG